MQLMEEKDDLNYLLTTKKGPKKQKNTKKPIQREKRHANKTYISSIASI